MKITIIGGGPGGLYAGLLLKKINSAFDIQIIERNPSDATYGWGVVFSDRTLNAFREADYPTYQEITTNFVIWSAIDTFYKEQLIRCDGHSFAGLSRRHLLAILQKRCQTLGVTLRFKTNVTDLAQFKDSNLIIAADGVNSHIRHTHAATFKPTIKQGQAKYIWFGTDKVLDSFTFIFQENKHGLFQVHAYPFDGYTSTFIVECEEAVWQRAGLDKADEAASIAYCQTLFANFLGGHKLLSNQSKWVNFLMVKNKTWQHKNIVLLGDSAHTAHFSIGSGTKLAMEDAIALANTIEQAQTSGQLSNLKDNLTTILNTYQLDRKPRVEFLQTVALESQTYFENIKRYTHLQPLQFTFQLLTRSGRINYDNLRVRDPYFVDKVDNWYQNQTTQPKLKTTLALAPPPIFTPLKLQNITLPNRVVISPISTYQATEGCPGEVHLTQLVEQAQRGSALILTEPVAISATGRITSGCVGLYQTEHLTAWQKIIETVHKQSTAKIILQLNHAGRRGSTQPRYQGLDRPLSTGGWPLIAPSALPYLPNSVTPQQMQKSDMKQVCAEFKQATKMADKVGVDMLLLNMAHGYLLGSFISPLSNQRQDGYGGSIKNRLRFPLDVLKTVRATWPDNKPLAISFSVTDWAKGGITLKNAVTIANQFKAQGCDLIQILAGQTIPHAKPEYKPGFLIVLSDFIRHEANISTLVGGYLTTTGQLNAILAAGRADLCIMT